MSIIKAIERAYAVMKERNYENIYWAIDLHGVCLKSNYKSGNYKWINEDVKECLQLISSLKENKIIIWSSCYPKEWWENIGDWLSKQIYHDFLFNYNPYIQNTDTGCFDRKFYFSILLDDKAGFDPDTDWKLIYEYLKNK